MGKPCREPGCSAIVASGAWCELHRRPDEARRWERYGPAWRRRARAYLRRHPVCEWPTRMGERGVTVNDMRCREPAAECDHIWPVKAATGRETDAELQALCSHHHSYKTQVFDRGITRRE